MKGRNRNVNTGLTIALTIAINTLVQAQPASAQFLEIATGALNALTGNRAQPQVIQQPIPLPPSHRNLSVGTNNLNGNNFNFCISGCLPNSDMASARTPQYPVSPPSPISVGVPQQSSIASTSIYTRTGTLPPGTIPQGLPIPTGVPMSGVIPQGIPHSLSPRPPVRPVLTIPPIQLPINF